MIPDFLLEKIQEKKCVAFIGAGFSMPCNMPGWKELLEWLIGNVEYFLKNSGEEAIQRVTTLMEENRLDEAVDILSNVTPPAELHTLIARRFHRNQCYKKAPKENQKRMKKRLYHLLSIPWAAIITTNYDTLIEDEISSQCPNSFSQYSPDDRSFRMIHNDMIDHPVFVKIHGSIEKGNYVLGANTYRNTYLLKDDIADFLRMIMVRYYVLFIGCSIEESILNIRKELSKKYDIYPTAYSVLPETLENRARRDELKRNNVWPILYTVDNGNEESSHMRVDRMLQMIQQKTADERQR